MTRLNAHFSVKGISLLNSVMSSSSLVQFKSYLCNQVGDIAGNEVSPTKQARVCVWVALLERSDTLQPRSKAPDKINEKMNWPVINLSSHCLELNSSLVNLYNYVQQQELPQYK